MAVAGIGIMTGSLVDGAYQEGVLDATRSKSKENDVTLAPSIPREEEKKYAYYRGGISMTPRKDEYVIKDGLVQPVDNKGVSINRKKSKVVAHGIPHGVVSIPEGLKIRQQGRDPDHYIIAPAYPMTLEEYTRLLNMIVLVPA